jgi:transposase
MARYGSVSRLVAWTGVAPGHDASVGKQHLGKTRKGDCVLHTDGVHATGARGGTRKETYLSTLYQHLAARRGRKRAIIAVAHAMVVSAFHRLSHHEPYHELGANDVDEQRRDHLLNHWTRRSQRRGYHVLLVPVQTA